MSNVLKSQLEYTAVVPGATATLPHTLSLAGAAALPDILNFDNPDFDYVSSTTTTVTVINNGAVAADCRVLCELWHSIERVFGTGARVLPNRPFVNRGVDSGRALTTGYFATFDPRIDGLAAAPGAVWAAIDCPIWFRKIGSDDTDWTLEVVGEAAVAACTTGVEINALYQGLARQPLLDFTPSHLLTPDAANDRFTDAIAGAHLTRQGLGSGAEITKSPLFDALSPHGQQGIEVDGNASYYAAVATDTYVVTTQPFVIGLLWSTTRNGEGGIAFGKYADPGLAGKGYAVSSNAQGGFGFLQNGALLDLNTDTPFGAPRVDDGHVRMFHFGRSNVGAGLGYVRTANIDPVQQVGQSGDLTASVATPFGLMTDTSVTRVVQGDHQFQKIAFWEGDAAENVTAYVAAIEQSLQSQLPAAVQPDFPSALLREPTPSTPVRVLGAAFQPNPLRPSLVIYSISFGSGGVGTGYVELRSDAANPPTTVRARSGGAVNVAIVVGTYGVVTYLVPPGHYVLLQAVVVAGAPALAIDSQTEISL